MKKQPQPKSAFGQKLKEVVSKTSFKLEPQRVVEQRKTPRKPILKLRELAVGDVITITYPLSPGRISGEFGAEVITCNQRFAHTKRLIPDKSPVACLLRQDGKTIVDGQNERAVTLHLPDTDQQKFLRDLKETLGARSPEMAPLEIGDIAAFVYPAHGDELAGVYFGQVADLAPKADADGDIRHRVLFFYPGGDTPYVDDVDIRRKKDGHWKDAKNGVDIRMVRRVTPAELDNFRLDRQDVVNAGVDIPAPKALFKKMPIPNRRKGPASQESIKRLQEKKNSRRRA